MYVFCRRDEDEEDDEVVKDEKWAHTVETLKTGNTKVSSLCRRIRRAQGEKGFEGAHLLLCSCGGVGCFRSQRTSVQASPYFLTFHRCRKRSMRTMARLGANEDYALLHLTLPLYSRRVER